ncbi:carbohydrate-binding domain-containing protein [Streptococcus tangpeifui]|uniref:carbohydrate-binding domain-containing protein n=1 Tax=Streptococcus tangpeifui TaxID=2709400 RepID=UPI0013EA0E09|nr:MULTISPECIES: carbohydrate-binding domain-containing protein [unclassified Streptococcus]
MNKKYLFNRQNFANAKGHGIKRRSSKGLLAGIILAGTLVILGAGQTVSADDHATAPEDKVTETATPDGLSQTVENQQTAAADRASSGDSGQTEEQPVNETKDQTEKQEALLNGKQTVSDEDEPEDDESEEDEEESDESFKTESSETAVAYDQEDDDDDEDKSTIIFSDAGAQSSSSRVTIDGQNVTISTAGTYTLTGSANGYHIAVADGVKGKVKLKLKAVNLTDSSISSVKDLSIKVSSDSSLSSSKATIEAGGALFITGKKKSTLTLTSTGSHAIKAKSLKAEDINLNLHSATKDGINAQTEVSIKNSNLTITAGDDGIQVSDSTDVNAGDLKIKDSTINITAASKGITVNDEVTVKGSTTIIIKSDSEGIEGRHVELKKGTVTIDSGDDVINATEWTAKDDADLSQLTNSPADIKNSVAIILSDADVNGIGYDDGIDSNGNLTVTGGNLKIQSKTDYSSAIDYDGIGLASGGTIWGIGHMGFAQGFSTGTKQAYIIGIASGLAGDTITVTDENGEVVAETKAEVDFDNVVYSSKDLKEGKTYTITTADGHPAKVRATKETTPHPEIRRDIPKDTIPLLPNGHHPAFPGSGTPPEDNH